MMVQLFSLTKETGISRAAKRCLGVTLCVAGLAGCADLSELSTELRKTYNDTLDSIDKSLNKNDYSVSVKAKNVERDTFVRLNRSETRRLQARLKKLGFRPGPVDGLLGSQTVKAINSYQNAFALPVTKSISTRFLAHLEAMSEKGFADKPSPPEPQTQQASLSPDKPDVPAAPVTLATDDLPTYLPGTTFIYSNGKTDRVVESKDLVVNWERGDGTAYSAHRNFLLPRLDWTSGKERGTTKISGTPESLWPSATGATISFKSKVTMQRGKDAASTRDYVDHWRCQNSGNEAITVEAGSFDTVVFVCRLGDDPASPKKIRTWYYAKSVRHYVRFVERDPENGTSSRADLVAVRPGALTWPPIVRAALTRALVHALDKPGDASQMPWTSSGVKTRVTIEAKARFVAEDGKSCRRFVQIWSENGLNRHYPAVACKTAEGNWAIPGLDSGEANSLATSGKVS
jgi:hypothetical protein